MLNSLMSVITHGADMTAAVGHAPQTALAAILCAALRCSLFLANRQWPANKILSFGPRDRYAYITRENWCWCSLLRK